MGLPNIDLFCPYSTEITSIECHCSRMIDFPFLSVPFDTLKLFLSNYTAGEEAANNSVYFVILFFSTYIDLTQVLLIVDLILTIQHLMA